MPDSKENKLTEQPPDSLPPILNNVRPGEETTTAKDWDLSLSNTLSVQNEQRPCKKPLTLVVTGAWCEQPESEAAVYGFGHKRGFAKAWLSSP